MGRIRAAVKKSGNNSTGALIDFPLFPKHASTFIQCLQASLIWPVCTRSKFVELIKVVCDSVTYLFNFH